MAQVGTASIKFEADVGQVSDTLISKMEEALSKIDTILARLPDSVDAQAKAAGDSLGSNIEDGAQRADAAVSDVGKGGFTAAEQASQRAADIVAGEFQSGSLDAESALAGITGDGFTIVTGSASSAASSVASRFVEEAGRAEAALTGIDGDGFRSATSSGTSAAGSIRDVMQQAASDAASAWNQATSEISAAWQEASAQADRSFGQGGGIAGKVAGGATAFLGLAGATNVMTSAFAKNTSIEDTTAVLEVLMGNAEDATALMDDLVESNWVTPIPFDIWADAGKTLVAFGMDADDVAGTVTALGEAGAASGDGAEGLSRLSRAFGQAMATGTMQNDTLNQLAEAGVPALDILANHYGVTSEEMKKMASEGLPAEEAIRVLTEGIMEGTDGVAGSTAAFSGTMAELAGTTSGTLGNLGAAFTNVASTAIDPLLGGLQSFAEWLTEVLYKGQDLIVWFQEGGPEVERLTKIIVGTAGAIMTLLLPAFVQARVQAGIMAAGKIAAWFKVQTAAWSAMTATVRSIAVMIGNWVRLGAQALIQGARIAAGWLIAMGPVGWIIGIIALVAGAFITLWNTSEGFRNFWIGLWDTIKNAASDAWLWIQETWQTYGQPVVDFVVSAFQWLWQALQLVFRLLGAAWEVFVTALGKAWDAWGQPIVDAVVAYFQWAWGNLQTVFGWVKTGWDLLWAGIQSVYNNVILPVIGWIVAGFQGLWSGLQTIFGWISGAISTVGSVMSGLWSDYVQPMIDRVVDGFNRLMDTIRGWKDNVIGWFSDAGTWLLDAGKNIVNGIIDGVKSMAGELANAFLNIVPDWVKDPFKEALGIASPSKVFAGYGRNIGEGIIEGVSGISSDVQAATSGLARAAADVPLPDPPTGSTTAALPSDTGLTDASASLGATMAPAWDSMAEQMTATTTSVIDPMLLSVQSGLQGTAAQFPLQAYGTVLPAWSSMAGNMAATKVGVIDPALAGITSNLQATSAQFPTQVWGSIVPAWQGMGSQIMGVKVGTIDPAFAGIQGGLQTVVGAFANGARDVGTHMDTMRRNTADPVRFTMNSIFSDGLVDMWNSVSDQIGTTKMAKKYASFATGGIIPGYTPGQDVHRFFSPTGGILDLSGGEPVLRPEAGRVLGSDWVHGINAAAASGGTKAVSRFLGAFAGGGFIPGGYVGGYRPGGVIYGGNFGGLSPITRSHAAWVGKHFPNMFTLTSANRYTDSGHHSRGQASDWQDPAMFATQRPSAASKALARAMYATFPTAAELIHWPEDGWRNHQHGTPVNFGMATNLGHQNHVHFATLGPIGGDAAGLDSVGINWDVDWDGMLRGMVAESLASIDAAAASANFPGNVGQIPPKTWNGMREPALTSMAESMEEHFKSMGDGGGAERWRPLAMQALARHGYNPADYIEAMLQQIQIESTGDPGAINRWDSNWLRGTPSGGLLQVIEPTYRRVRATYPGAFDGLPDDMMFPLTNLTAGVGAVRMDWGGPGNRWPTRDGYHLGGEMGNGPGLFHKTAFAPERVLSPRQTESFDRLVDWVTDTPEPIIRDRVGGGTSGSYGSGIKREVHVTQHITTSDPKQAGDRAADKLTSLIV